MARKRFSVWDLCNFNFPSFLDLVFLSCPLCLAAWTMGSVRLLYPRRKEQQTKAASPEGSHQTLQRTVRKHTSVRQGRLLSVGGPAVARPSHLMQVIHHITITITIMIIIRSENNVISCFIPPTEKSSTRVIRIDDNVSSHLLPS